MGSYNIHAGHCPQGQGAYGAVGVLQESVEDRLVKNRVISALRNAGQTVYDCTDDTNCDEGTNLARIVNKCNQRKVDLDVSIHLNSGRNDYSGDGSIGGVEVWCYDSGTAAVAQRICNNISSKLGLTNRGVKYNQGWYVLKNTVSPALLVECCFVDDKDDAGRWDVNACGDAIASGILNRSVTGAAATSTKLAQVPGNAAYADRRINYRVHQQSVGTLPVVRDGQTAGITGQSKRIEGLRIDVKVPDFECKVKGYLQSIGVVDYGKLTRDLLIGTEGKSTRLEGIQFYDIKSSTWDIYIRYHVQGRGWSSWVKNDAYAGTTGFGLRLEGFQFKLVHK